MRLPGLLLALSLVAGCARDAPGTPTSSSAPGLSEVADRAQLYVDADARLLTERLRSAAHDPSPDRRRLAVLLLARMRDPEAVSLLRAALRDVDPVVRTHASLGLAGLASALGVDPEPTLLGALAAESERDARVALTRDLGALGTSKSLPALGQALGSEDAAERGAACGALGGYGARQRPIPEDLLRQLATRSVDDPSPQVRLLCTHALARLPPAVSPDGRRALLAELGRAVTDEGAETRTQALRALVAYPELPLELVLRTLEDADHRVRLQAFRTVAAIARDTTDRELARALRAQLQRVLALDPIGGVEVVVLLDALEAARPVARAAGTYALATEALAQVEALPPPRRNRALGLLHCALAALADHGRAWPSRLEGCGFGHVSEGSRRAEMAAVLAVGQGSDPLRAAFLGRLFGDSDEHVREAALGAAVTVADPAATVLLLRGLGDTDFGVVTAACDAVASLAAAWSTAAPASRTPPPPAPAALQAALRTAHARLVAASAAEGLAAWLAVVEHAAGTFPEAEVRALARHPAAPVRRRALSLLAGRGLAAPEEPPLPVPNPIDSSLLPAPEVPLHVRIGTEAGEILVRLEPAHAPVTVARFLGLLDARLYDGLTFHRVVPGFVAQGGDPRADGYGGPGWTMRDEPDRLPFLRGTLGIALAGPDTGGSQFFITQADQPQLDGHYTAFGRVVEGMEVVDALLPGAAILEVRRAPPPE